MATKNFTVTSSLDEVITISEGMHYVTATDKFLSGWGMASGKICKRVIICETFRQAQRMADAMKNDKRSGMSYINISSRFPKYNVNRYKVCYSTYEEFNNKRWMQYTQIPE